MLFFLAHHLFDEIISAYVSRPKTSIGRHPINCCATLWRATDRFSPVVYRRNLALVPSVPYQARELGLVLRVPPYFSNVTYFPYFVILAANRAPSFFHTFPYQRFFELIVQFIVIPSDSHT